ncbi:MAG: hypothetical protein K9H65_04695 [Bacteroidales bacterium]|nr:hypothetical protein [Bacteroidales bacterium]
MKILNKEDPDKPYLHKDPVFSDIAGPVINIILGATVIHELIGPVIAKFSLRKAGEIGKNS